MFAVKTNRAMSGSTDSAFQSNGLKQLSKLEVNMFKVKATAVLLACLSSVAVAQSVSGNCGGGQGSGNACMMLAPGNGTATQTSPTNITVTTTPNVANTATSMAGAGAGAWSNSQGGAATVGNLTTGPSTAITGPSTAKIGNVTTGPSTSSAVANGGLGGAGGSSSAVANGGAGGLGGQGGTAVANGGLGGQGGQGGIGQGGQGGQGGAVSGNTVQSNSEINVNTTTVTNVPRAPVASAIAPNTIFSGGMDSCMGSTTGSVQGLSIGVAIGTTWTDGHCVALRAAVRLNELGFKKTAAARLCAIPEIAEAFKMSGEFECVTTPKE